MCGCAGSGLVVVELPMGFVGGLVRDAIVGVVRLCDCNSVVKERSDVVAGHCQSAKCLEEEYREWLVNFKMFSLALWWLAVQLGSWQGPGVCQASARARVLSIC